MKYSVVIETSCIKIVPHEFINWGSAIVLKLFFQYLWNIKSIKLNLNVKLKNAFPKNANNIHLNIFKFVFNK